MPRADVPYPSREICSLKCQIDALQRQINELMKSVNGVQGDGQGNVSLVSGDPAVVINNDAAQHEVEISLDQSQLPAAAVQSVNGQTGVVQLEADDIASDGNSDVQTDIDTLKNLGVTLQGAINGEITARGNADAALQGNINTLQASIPGEAAQAVANDPTVQGLVTADAQNVKLSGAQTVGGVKTFTATPIVPTPAAGSTDGSVPNTNWISQTGNSAPNNLVHKTGDETINGTKTFMQNVIGRNCGDYIGNVGGPILNNHVDYTEGMKVNINYNTGFKFRIQGSANNNNYIDADYAFVFSRSGTQPALYCIKKKFSYINVEPKVYFDIDSNNNVITFYFRKTQYTSQHVYITEYFSYGAYYNPSETNKVKLSENAGTIVTLPATAVSEVVI